MIKINFIAGAILQHSAVAIVLIALLAVLIRRRRSSLMVALDTLAWLVIASGGLVGLAMLWEFVQLLQAGNLLEKAALANRAGGREALSFWLSGLAMAVVPHLFWWRRCRATPWLALLIGLVISTPFLLAMLPPWIA